MYIMNGALIIQTFDYLNMSRSQGGQIIKGAADGQIFEGYKLICVSCIDQFFI